MNLISYIKELIDNSTYFYERLSGVVLYAVVLLFFFFFILKKKTSKNLTIALNAYMVVLAVMAFFYVPAPSADLSRWRIITAIWPDMPLSYYVNTLLLSTPTPTAYVMMYLCSLTRIDGLLPALCALIFFYNFFYILKDLNRRHNVSPSAIAYALLFVMSTGCFLEVISGVRCLVSLSILARCFYDELYNKKSLFKNIPWALIASLMHAMALVVYAIWLAFRLYTGTKRTGGFVLISRLVLLLGIVILSVGQVYIINSAINKALAFLTNGDSYSYIWEYLIRAISTGLLIAVFYKLRNTKYTDNRAAFFAFNLLLVFLEIVLCFEYSTSHRLTSLSLLTCLPFLCSYVSEDNGKKVRKIVFTVSIVLLLLSCARGNLSGYKFFLLGN